MSTLTLTVEGPEVVIALLHAALSESDKVTVCPEVIYPGYNVGLVEFRSETEGRT